MSDTENREPGPQGPAASRKSAAEKADAVLEGAEAAGDFVGRLILKLYALVLIIAGLAAVFWVPTLISGGWQLYALGIALGLYGLYLLWPGGDKWVIW